MEKPLSVSRSLPRHLLSTAEVARWLGMSSRTVCLWAESLYLPGFKVGRQWRFREADIRSWLQRSEARALTASDFRKT
ncbi:MAG: helix-turn-helix domain-containing protein [Bryobacteraceae bacterium]|nr:helix-turn-helix domain-containing protein [Bryobacteraceae bacterium]